MLTSPVVRNVSNMRMDLERSSIFLEKPVELLFPVRFSTQFFLRLCLRFFSQKPLRLSTVFSSRVANLNTDKYTWISNQISLKNQKKDESWLDRMRLY